MARPSKVRSTKSTPRQRVASEPRRKQGAESVVEQRVAVRRASALQALLLALIGVVVGVFAWNQFPKTRELPLALGRYEYGGVVVIFDRPGVEAELWATSSFRDIDGWLSVQLVFTDEVPPPEGTRFALIASGVDFTSSADARAGVKAQLLYGPRGRRVPSFDGYAVSYKRDGKEDESGYPATVQDSPYVIIGSVQSSDPSFLRIPNYAFPFGSSAGGYVFDSGALGHTAAVAVKPGADRDPFFNSSGSLTTGAIPFLGTPTFHDSAASPYYLSNTGERSWYAADALTVHIRPGFLTPFDSVQSAVPERDRTEHLEWTFNGGGSIKFRVEDQVEQRAEQRSDTENAFIAGIGISLAASLLVAALQAWIGKNHLRRAP